MEISRGAATAKGPAETFTGDVWVDPITRGLAPSQLNVAAVRFTPGARSAWHSHDGEQTLYITEGRGLVQVRGQQIAELNPGDVIYAPHGEEHWHGDVEEREQPMLPRGGQERPELSNGPHGSWLGGLRARPLGPFNGIAADEPVDDDSIAERSSSTLSRLWGSQRSPRVSSHPILAR